MARNAYPKHKNIFRIETGNTIGWQVRIERRKRSYSKFFSDALHDGTAPALQAALQWRNTALTRLPDHEVATSHLHTPRNKRKAAEAMNRTGVIGIGFSLYTLRHGDKAPYVTCHWRDPATGERRSSSFSINKHGLRGALRLACRRLREGQGEAPSKEQVYYLARKAYPGVRQLYDAAVAQGILPPPLKNEA